jgi:hypothetical protein
MGQRPYGYPGIRGKSASAMWGLGGFGDVLFYDGVTWTIAFGVFPVSATQQALVYEATKP